MYRLNVVGCGKVGRVLAAALWRGEGISEISVCNRSLMSTRASQEFVGAGRICQSVQELPEADLWLVGAQDSQLVGLDETLAQLASLRAGQIVFHCSGAYPSSLLRLVREKGAAVASFHPIQSFADPARALDSFRGTLCSVEGDPRAYEVLSDLFGRVGARVFRISSEQKLICHAGHVFASNYLVVVLDAARRLYEQVGMSDEISRACIESLARGALTNVSYMGTDRALTGPVARGDVELVRAQHDALGLIPTNSDGFDPRALYAILARAATDIAERRGEVDSAALRDLRELLRVGNES